MLLVLCNGLRYCGSRIRYGTKLSAPARNLRRGESAEVKAVKVDVKTELWEAQIDADKVNPLIDAKYAAKAQLAKTMVKALADAQAVLTPEQRVQMKEIKTDRYISQSGILGSKYDGKSCPFAAKHKA